MPPARGRRAAGASRLLMLPMLVALAQALAGDAAADAPRTQKPLPQLQPVQRASGPPAPQSSARHGAMFALVGVVQAIAAGGGVGGASIAGGGAGLGGDAGAAQRVGAQRIGAVGHGLSSGRLGDVVSRPRPAGGPMLVPLYLLLGGFANTAAVALSNARWGTGHLAGGGGGALEPAAPENLRQSPPQTEPLASTLIPQHICGVHRQRAGVRAAEEVRQRLGGVNSGPSTARVSALCFGAAAATSPPPLVAGTQSLTAPWLPTTSSCCCSRPP
jgi:hypothetical protein